MMHRLECDASAECGCDCRCHERRLAPSLPGVCQDCRRPLVWNGRRWTTPSGQTHGCEVRCGAWMPACRDRCGRRTGHAVGHRSQYAVDNERIAKRRVRAA